MAGGSQARAFAATWRNSAGETIATTSAHTMCRFPRLPHRLRFFRDGFSGVLPCRECPNCLEFERQRLAERLHAKYGSNAEQRSTDRSMLRKNHCDSRRRSAGPLFVIRIWAPLELHAAIAHRLHRRRGLDLLPGFARLGTSSFALLSRSALPPRTTLRAMGLKFRIEPLKLGRGRRAWRPVTEGLLVAREIYGEETNRYYFPGIPPAEREKWEVRKIDVYQHYDPARSPRAFRDGGVVLVPPEVWKLSRLDRRSFLTLLRRAPNPEGVARVMGLVRDAVISQAVRFRVSVAPEGRLTREQVAEWYRKNAERAAARTSFSDPALMTTPSSERGGYTSSEHSQGELMPEQLAEAERSKWKKGRAAKALAESLAIIERMRKKSLGGG